MPSPLHPDPRFATTLAHGLSLLQCFHVGEPVLSNKELAHRTGLSKATITRLTYTLAARGLLMYDSRLRRYRLGSTVVSLGYPLLASLRVRQLARPLMKRLADRVGGSVSLGIRDRINMVYVETSRGHDTIAFRPDIGASLPMLPTAMGRAWLSQAPAALRDEVLAQIRIALPAHCDLHADALRAAQDDLERNGFCVSRGDWQQDVHAVAVPMAGEIDGETMVFNCGVPTARLRPRKLEREMGPQLIRLVRRIEVELGMR